MRRSREPAWCVGGGHAKAVITGGWKSLSRCAGVTRVLLLAGFAAQRVIDYAASTPLKARFGLEIEVTIEPQRAGTGGAVWYARDRLDDQFFLLNGDPWFDINPSICLTLPAASSANLRRPAQSQSNRCQMLPVMAWSRSKMVDSRDFAIAPSAREADW